MRKILKISGLVILFLFLALLLLPYLFKGKILELAKKTINDNIEANVAFTDIDLSLIRSFPNLQVDVEKISVVNKGYFDGDTLASIETLTLIVNLKSVISGDQIDLKKINVVQPRIFLAVSDSGKVNWDITKSAEDQDQQNSTDSSPLNLMLKSYSISNGYLAYNDYEGDMHVILEGLNHKGSGDFTQDIFSLLTKTEIASTTYTMDGIDYIHKAKTIADVEMEINLPESKYTFKENNVKLNELEFALNGFVAMPGEDIDMDLDFSVAKNEFKNFMSMIPGVYSNEFGKVESSGSLEFKGNIKGVYNETSLPAYNVDLKVNNGNFNYPDLPEKLTEVNIDLNITNPDGETDNTIIRLEKLHLKFGSSPIDAALLVKNPVSDPYLDGFIKGSVDLDKVKSFIPLEEGENVSGKIDADITLKGRVSAIENKRYQDFTAEGRFLATNINYSSPSTPLPVSVPNLELIFNPRNLTVNDFQLNIGRTNLKMNGWVDNLLVYVFNENELLKATLDVEADIIDLNELNSGEESESAGTDSSNNGVVKIPEYIDFLMTLSAKTVYYDNLVLNNISGNLAMRDQTLGLNDLKFNTLDGNMLMNGVYNSKDTLNPQFFFNMNVEKVNIRKCYDAFGTIQKLAPIAEKCNGNASTEIRIQGQFDENMEADLNSLAGYGKLTTHGVTIDNFKPLVKVADVLKMEQFKKAELSDANISFNFENGRVTLKPFEVKVSGIESTVDGSHGFDQSMDYNVTMQVPTKLMGKEANQAINSLFASANSAGLNLTMAEKIPVKLKITGSSSDPKVSADLGKTASSAGKALEDQAKQEFEKQKQALEQKAKEELEKQKREAEEKLRQEAEKAQKELEEKARKESEKLKKEAEEKLLKEGKDKLKDLFGKPK